MRLSRLLDGERIKAAYLVSNGKIEALKKARGLPRLFTQAFSGELIIRHNDEALFIKKDGGFVRIVK